MTLLAFLKGRQSLLLRDLILEQVRGRCRLAAPAGKRCPSPHFTEEVTAGKKRGQKETNREGVLETMLTVL